MTHTLFVDLAGQLLEEVRVKPQVESFAPVYDDRGCLPVEELGQNFAEGLSSLLRCPIYVNIDECCLFEISRQIKEAELFHNVLEAGDFKLAALQSQ